MKLLSLNISHRLINIDDQQLNVPVHLYTNRLEGDINLQGLYGVEMLNTSKGEPAKIRLSMRYVEIRVSILKRHKKIFDDWVKRSYESQQLDIPVQKPKIVFQGHYDTITCHGAILNNVEFNKSQEVLGITCEVMDYDIEHQILSRKFQHQLATNWQIEV